jgi:uncharacterized protein YecE (DUF72 family)
MSIRVGIGGWTFEPWRGVFYPDDLPQKRELEYASRKLTSIEINGTYYGSQKPESFARWRAETPDDFVFSVKGPRFATNRRILAEAGESIDRFFKSGVLELKEKLGPINWQFATTKKFDPDDFEAFLKLLPHEAQDRAIHHVVELRHESFKTPEAIALMRKHGVAIVLTDSDEHPNIHDVTAPFVYLRLMEASEKARVGYTPSALGLWAKRANEWSMGGAPADLDLVAPADGEASKVRDVFVYFINGYKPKAPAAAMAMIELLNTAA